MKSAGSLLGVILFVWSIIFPCAVYPAEPRSATDATSESNKSVPNELTVPRDSTTSKICVAWTDGCVNCTRVKEKQIECSNIGIACQPGRIRCLENK
jgi:hypothetical protein